MKQYKRENWKQVNDFPNYEVSDLGQVVNKTTKHILATPTNSEYGHRRVFLYKDGKETRIALHRLVLMTFVGACPQGMECRHLDGNASNNHLDNLEWNTRSINGYDRATHGTTPKFSEQQMQAIKKQYRPHTYSMVKLAREYGVTKGAIHYIVKRRPDTDDLKGKKK